MQQSIERKTLLAAIRVRLTESPVVALLGARQVGKTTLAEQVAADWAGPTETFDLENSTTRAALSATPEKLLAERAGLVIVDEVQRLPALFAVLRPLCDRRQRKAVFLLLGSASWDLVKGVSETLAGRIQFVDVPGFSLAEVGPDQQDKLWLRGGFPRAFLAESTAAWERWMESFTRTFLERDIPGLGSKVSPVALGRFWRMLAHFHGQIWNAAELARSMDVSVMAVNHYRDLLAGTFMVRVLLPWFENQGKRLVKSPKVYVRDSGLVHALLGLETRDAVLGHPVAGGSWEGFVIENLINVAPEGTAASFYRTSAGAEIDLVLELPGGALWAIEVKRGLVPKVERGFYNACEDLAPQRRYVVYSGIEHYALGNKIEAISLFDLAAFLAKQ